MWEDPFDEYEVPVTWTPEHVMHRMVGACDVAFRLRDTVGPKRLKAAWPSYWNDLESEYDRISEMPGESVVERDRRLFLQTWEEWERDNPPDAHEISMMQEAAGWPGRYLRFDERRVAIVRWARRRASGKEETEISVQLAFGEAQIIARGLVRDAVIVR